MRNKIQQLLADLRLRGIAQTLDQELDMADKKGTSDSEVIYRLLMEEHKYRQERSLEYQIKSAKKLFNYDLLLIDELGYLTLKPEQINALFKLMGERYGRKSTIITTNLDYPEWYDLF